MKILFLISRFLDGGIDTVLVEYLNAMCRLTDNEVTLAIGIKMNESEVFLPRINKDVKIEYLVDQNWLTAYKRTKHHHRKNALWGAFDEIFLNPIRRMQMHSRLRALSEDNDVVIDFDACFGSFVSDVPASTRKLVWFHFSIAREAQRSPKRIKRLQQQFASYDNIVLIADDMLREATEIMPEYKDKFCRIYNCLNQELIERKASEAVTDNRIDKLFFLAVERLEESQKDLTTLIKAYSKLPEDSPYLYIIGEGGSRQELEILINSLNLKDRIIFLGFKSNPYPWIKRSIALVHSSKYEGLPTVLIEALLLDKVIISTNCPTGPREILGDGMSGILTPVGDTDALADAMIRVTKDKEYVSHLQDNARQHKRLFLPANAIEQLQHILRL